jgi:predicted DNA binding CopG/RHH family protein
MRSKHGRYTLLNEHFRFGRKRKFACICSFNIDKTAVANTISTAMSVTLNIPTHIMERAGMIASAEGISLDTLVSRLLDTLPQQPPQAPSAADPLAILGRLRGTVVSIADDFDAPLEDFQDYMQ